MNNGFIIIGDTDARFGKTVRNLLAQVNFPNSETLSYPVIPGDMNTGNTNAELLSSLCTENNLLVINNLETSRRHYVGNRTYKKSGTWILKLDTFIASYNRI